MTSRTHVDPAFLETRDRGTEGLELFAEVEPPKLSLKELVERVRIDPPSVPVPSSERGSDRAKKRQPAQHARIIAELGKAGCVPGSGRYLSRDEIAKRCEVRETAMCGRLGPSGGLLMPDGKDAGPWAIRRKPDAGISSAGEKVFGYQLTDYGLGLVQEAGIILEPAPTTATVEAA